MEKERNPDTALTTRGRGALLGIAGRRNVLLQRLERAAVAANSLRSGDDELAAALRFASAAAALKCQAPGRRGCPTRTAVEEFLKRVQTEPTP